jgi:hypothetical protein
MAKRVFVGITSPADPNVETQVEVPDRSFEPHKNWR